MHPSIRKGETDTEAEQPPFAKLGGAERHRCCEAEDSTRFPIPSVLPKEKGKGPHHQALTLTAMAKQSYSCRESQAAVEADTG